MRTYPIHDEAGDMFAFEIANVVVARRFAALLQSIDGVSDVRPRRRWTGSPDVHIRFRDRDREYIVWEPYGDSSRWWIGPDDDNPAHGSVEGIERAIANASSWMLAWPFGRWSR
jgi:hypothetical protein